MKILNINSYYFSSSLYKPMEDNLIKDGFELSTYVPLNYNYKARDEVKFDPPNYVDISKCYRKYDRLLFQYKQYKIKKDFFNKYNFNDYDILHAHSLFSNGYLAYAAYKQYKIPYIVAVRSTDINVFFNKMPHLRHLGINILTHSYKIIFLSNSYKKECIENYIPKKYKNLIQNKAELIPNGINEFWFQNKMNKPKKRTKDLIKLIFVGNDSKRKNLKTVVRSSQILIQKKYDVELTVVGKVSNKTYEELKNMNFINFKGNVNKEDLLLLYRQNDIFVMPSLKETFGLVYAEAMSQGLPVIYTKGQGFDEQYTEGSVGYAVDGLNANEISQMILKITRQYNEISGSCVNLVEKFKWENIILDYKRIYEKVN